MKTIETRYKGYRFRSRLEARWAVFFDALGLRWEYEPEGFELPSGRYLPDFRVVYPGRNDSEHHFEWFEVKSDVGRVTNDEWVKLLEFEPGIVLLDGVPDARMYLPPRWCLEGLGPDEEDAASTWRQLPRPLRANKDAKAFERCGYALWCPKGRLWWDEHSNFFSPGSYFDCGGGVLEKAVAAARGVRFEFGETPR